MLQKILAWFRPAQREEQTVGKKGLAHQWGQMSPFGKTALLLFCAAAAAVAVFRSVIG